MRINSFFFFISFFVSELTFAAGAGEGSVLDLKWKVVNATIFFGFLFYKLRNPIREAFNSNAKKIIDLVESAEEKSKASKIKYDTYLKKTENLPKKTEEIFSSVKRDLEVFEADCERETRARLERIKIDLVNKVKYEAESLSRASQAELLETVFNNAKTKIKTDKTLQQRATEKLVGHIG